MLLLVNAVNAQSKKKINQQLSKQLMSVTAMYDSIRKKDNFFRTENKEMRKEIKSLNALMNETRTHALASVVAISMVKEELFADNYDVESVISEAELEMALSNLSKKDYDDELNNIRDTSRIPQIGKLPDLSGYKLKVQNELLKARIDEYNKVNDLLMKDLISQALLWDNIRYLNHKLSADLEDIALLGSELNRKMELLRNAKAEIERKKEEERLKAEQSLTKKNKNSKTKVTFVPPVVIDEAENTNMEEPPVLKEGSDESLVGFLPLPEPVLQEEVTYDVVEEEAEFPGGRAAMNKYLLESIRMPEMVNSGDVSGKCYVKFVVNASGQISNVQILRGVPDCPECDAEAMRAVKQMPAWKPAKVKERAVRQWVTVPIKFLPNE